MFRIDEYLRNSVTAGPTNHFLAFCAFKADIYFIEGYTLVPQKSFGPHTIGTIRRGINRDIRHVYLRFEIAPGKYSRIACELKVPLHAAK
jgi:hypothetical protein